MFLFAFVVSTTVDFHAISYFPFTVNIRGDRPLSVTQRRRNMFVCCVLVENRDRGLLKNKKTNQTLFNLNGKKKMVKGFLLSLLKHKKKSDVSKGSRKQPMCSHVQRPM